MGNGRTPTRIFIYGSYRVTDRGRIAVALNTDRETAMKNKETRCDERITIRLPKQLVARITKERLLSDRTTSDIVRTSLVEHLSARTA